MRKLRRAFAAVVLIAAAGVLSVGCDNEPEIPEPLEPEPWPAPEQPEPVPEPSQ